MIMPKLTLLQKSPYLSPSLQLLISTFRADQNALLFNIVTGCGFGMYSNDQIKIPCKRLFIFLTNFLYKWA